MNRRSFIAGVGLLAASPAFGIDRRRLVTQVFGQPRKIVLKTFAEKVIDWTSGGLARYGGTPNWTGGNTSSANVTYISDKAGNIIQSGRITRYTVSVNSRVAGSTIIFKHFRRTSATNWNFISESPALDIPATGTQAFDLSTPFDVVRGDCIGACCPVANTKLNLSLAAGGLAWTNYLSGNISESSNFTNSHSSFIDIKAFGARPFVATTGDSITTGWNLSNSFYDAGPLYSEDATYELANMLYVISSGVCTAQSHGKANQTFAWVLSTGIVSALAADPKVIFIHCGVNDVATGRTWEQVLADLNAIRALVPSTKILVIDEIFPWTAGNPTQDATILTWNSNLAAWCAANSAYLLSSYAAMSDPGASNNLLPAYDRDGVHLTPAGVAAWAQLVYAKLQQIV